MSSSARRILSSDEVEHRTGVNKPTRWRWERQGQFPMRLRLVEDGKLNGYYEDEIDNWINTRMRGIREQPTPIQNRTEAET